MPVIWGSHNNSDIFMSVAILDASSLGPSIVGAPPLGGSIPSPNMFKALIDTGAQSTMISPSVVATLQLSALGRILVSGVGPTAHYHNAYLFYVAFVVPVLTPGQSLTPGGQVQALVNIHQNPIFGAEIPSTGGLFDVLLGMDIISTGQLLVGSNIFSFSY